MSIKKEKIKVYDMTCNSCESRVEKAIKHIDGVIYAKASYCGQYAVIEYDDTKCKLDKIKASVKKAGYNTEDSNDYKFMGILIVVAAIVLLGMKTSGFDMEAKLANASYAVLFLVGVLTSIHCVGMCGGIMLSQSLTKVSKNKFEAIEPALMYNLGRVVSYTVLGGIIGALGSVFSLSIATQSALQIFAGAFMIIMGLNMTGFSAFRKLNIKLPFSSCKVKNKPRTPFLVGLLNGLMPCGPLQTMQLFALGTGSATKGALSMFMFSLGTVPLMLTFGAVSGLLSKGYTKKILKFSGVLIIVLGLIMGNRGFTLAGININPLTAFENITEGLSTGKPGNANNSSNSSNSPSDNDSKAIIKDGVQTLKMTASNRGYTPNVLYVQKGIPVKWVIDGQQINSCNNAIVAKSIKVEKKLKSGENIIEFTPGDKDINFSCWMGMIRGKIKVVDNLGSVDATSSSNLSTEVKRSIYGTDISKAKTEFLVNKAVKSNGSQSAKFNGIGYEFQPLIAVTESNLNTKVTFDLSNFDEAESEFYILDGDTTEEVTSFNGKKGISEIELSPNKSGFYMIVKDDSILGIIQVVDNLDNADLEEIRKTYLK
ncbi:hypothetical protein SDC9_63717 [bioreactor metagenome]|uniref:HMA domain-containing protein n=1 Tax=bioreactor metagenome TaxID=1076179 RepID=A0A644XMG3_9ZZZZ